MPTSPLGALQERVARMEQRVDDLLRRVVDQFDGVATDFRAFGPMLQDHATFRADLGHLLENYRRDSTTFQEDLREIRRELVELEHKLDQEAIARVKGQEERKQELQHAIDERLKDTRQTRMMLRVAAIGLLGTFLTSAGGVLAAVLTGSGHG